jgi:hypothetical protein
MSHAVKWREPSGRTFLGRHESGSNALVLQGRNGGQGTIRRTIKFDELRSYRVGRCREERLDVQPTLVVERPGGDFLVTSTVVP